VQIGSREYTFSNSGVIYHQPFEAGEEAVFKETLTMGQVPSMSAVNAAVQELRHQFAPGTYDLVKQNCNHFTQALVNKLLGKSIPGYINRSANLGSTFAAKDTKSQDKKAKCTKPEAPKKASTERRKLTDKQQKMLDKLQKKAPKGSSGDE